MIEFRLSSKPLTARQSYDPVAFLQKVMDEAYESSLFKRALGRLAIDFTRYVPFEVDNVADARVGANKLKGFPVRSILRRHCDSHRANERAVLGGSLIDGQGQLGSSYRVRRLFIVAQY
jgi:hypothetical protein